MDEKVAQRLATTMTEDRATILEHWIDTVQVMLRDRLTTAESSRQLDDLFTALQGALAAGATGVRDRAAAELLDVLADLSRRRARQGFTATETAISVFGVKAALRPDPGSDVQAFADHAEFSEFVDQLGLYTFETYLATREALITEQAEQLLELSTPVVKLWDGVVAVPLVGTLDSARSQVVMERLLQALVDTGSPYAILDITGVPAVDTQVAQHILKTVMAAQLMGAQCIISGIRPQIAQTIVSLGIEFGDIVTKANLSDALQHALTLRGAEIVRRVAPKAVV